MDAQSASTSMCLLSHIIVFSCASRSRIISSHAVFSRRAWPGHHEQWAMCEAYWYLFSLLSPVAGVAVVEQPTSSVDTIGRGSPRDAWLHGG